MAPQRPADRDDGMRRISSTTRWLAGLGVAFVAAFSLFFAERASSSSGSSNTPTVNAPAATTPTTVGGTSDGGATSVTPSTVQTAPPATYAPQVHTRSRGS